MKLAPFPVDESERLADLRALEILDTPAEERFNRIVRLALRIFGVPMAYVALIDSDRQWLKAKCGLKVDQTGRDISFCGHTILSSEPLVVPDAREDERFFDNPLVLREPFVRFYAGYPLAGRHGHNVGTFCLADTKPRTLDAKQLAILRELAALAEHELNMVDVIQAQRELLETKQQLVESQRRLAAELAQAAEYIRSLLPAPLEGAVRTDWAYVSSSQLGGDLFGYHWLDADRLVIYLLDVCGHGVGASLLASSVHDALHRGLPGAEPADPAAVLAALNRAFPMEEHNNKFFTIWYGVLDLSSRLLCYAAGGHHPALLLTRPGEPPERLSSSQLMIGIVPEATYEITTCLLPPAARLYVFSDGVFEVRRPDGKLLGLDGLSQLLARVQVLPKQRVQRVWQEIRALHQGQGLDDDFSLLEIEV